MDILKYLRMQMRNDGRCFRACKLLRKLDLYVTGYSLKSVHD